MLWDRNTLLNAFICIYWDDHIFILLFMWYITWIWSCCTLHACMHEINLILIMMYDPFNILLNLVYWYFVEDFCIYVYQECWLVFFFFLRSFTWWLFKMQDSGVLKYMSIWAACHPPVKGHMRGKTQTLIKSWVLWTLLPLGSRRMGSITQSGIIFGRLFHSGNEKVDFCADRGLRPSI